MATANGIPGGNGTRSRGLLLVGAVFLLGLICGSALTVIGVRTVLPIGRHPRVGGPGPGVRPGPGPGHERMLMQLDLDPGQRQRVEEILERRRSEIDRIFEESREEVRALLTEEQREILDRMRRRPRRGRPGP